jgi:uncharacterized membrane protein SpoIIM required for sporulation
MSAGLGQCRQDIQSEIVARRALRVSGIAYLIFFFSVIEGYYLIVGNNKDRYYAADHVLSKLLSDGDDNRHLGLGNLGKSSINHRKNRYL